MKDEWSGTKIFGAIFYFSPKRKNNLSKNFPGS